MLRLRLLYGVCAHLKAAHESIKQNRKEQKNTAVVETAGRTVQIVEHASDDNTHDRIADDGGDGNVEAIADSMDVAFYVYSNLVGE